MNFDLMRLIDKQFLKAPFYGLRQMTWHLRDEDHLLNEKRNRRLMRLMGVGRGNDLPDRFLTLLTPDLPETQHQQGGEGSQDLPLLAAWFAGGSAQSGLVR
ncbi:MAG: IS3 family transposase [Halocynthiibacter sp.]